MQRVGERSYMRREDDKTLVPQLDDTTNIPWYSLTGTVHADQGYQH